MCLSLKNRIFTKKLFLQKFQARHNFNLYNDRKKSYIDVVDREVVYICASLIVSFQWLLTEIRLFSMCQLSKNNGTSKKKCDFDPRSNFGEVLAQNVKRTKFYILQFVHFTVKMLR